MADPEFFTLAEFRALPGMDDVDPNTGYPDAKVLAAAAYFTAIVKRELPDLIRSSRTETLDGLGYPTLLLSQAYPTALTSVTVDGNAVAPNTLSLNPAGVVRYLNGGYWSNRAYSNVVVTYTAGEFETCPDDVKDAVMWATRDRLMSQADESGIDVRKTSMSTDFGTTNYILPGEKRPTGYPDLDAAIAGRLRAMPPAVS